MPSYNENQEPPHAPRLESPIAHRCDMSDDGIRNVAGPISFITFNELHIIQRRRPISLSREYNDGGKLFGHLRRLHSQLTACRILSKKDGAYRLMISRSVRVD